MKNRVPLLLALASTAAAQTGAAATEYAPIGRPDQGLPVVAGGLPLNVEIDYMVAADHSHMPQPMELMAIEQMFACHGITINLVVDDAIPETALMQCQNVGDPFFNCGGAQSFLSVQVQWFDNGPIGWHYCVFGHQYDDGGPLDSSGLADPDGRDFIVTLGAFLDEDNAPIGTPFERASTFAHELGHNLGLGHSSPASVSVGGPYAPNYASVMSYQYQLSGIRTKMRCLGMVDVAHLFKDLDYSNGRLPTLDESALSEAIGSGIRSVDWDCSQSLEATVTKNLDGDGPGPGQGPGGVWCGLGAGVSVLNDWNDWGSLVDVAYSAPLASTTTPPTPCITATEARRTTPARYAGAGGPLSDPDDCPDVLPTLAIEACPTGEMVFVTPTPPAGGQDGTGFAPWYGLDVAAANASSTSILYLQPGTHGVVNGTSLSIATPLVLSAPAPAVVDP